MIDRNVLQEKIIDKMADAFLKALPAGETGIWLKELVSHRIMCTHICGYI
jgi:hypothetical protein